MKRIYILINTISLALLLSACGGGSGSSGDGLFDSGNTKISLSLCNNTNSSFTAIEDEDLLKKQSADARVNIVHDSNDNKKICLLSGEAYLIRKN